MLATVLRSIRLRTWYFFVSNVEKKDCDAIVNNNEVSYRLTKIQRFHNRNFVKILYNGGLKKIGVHKVHRRDICRVDAIDIESFHDGDLSEKDLVNKQ